MFCYDVVSSVRSWIFMICQSVESGWKLLFTLDQSVDRQLIVNWLHATGWQSRDMLYSINQLISTCNQLNSTATDWFQRSTPFQSVEFNRLHAISWQCKRPLKARLHYQPVDDQLIDFNRLIVNWLKSISWSSTDWIQLIDSVNDHCQSVDVNWLNSTINMLTVW